MYLSVGESEGPLDLADFDRLQAVLARDPQRCMNVEMLDGYFAGLVCAPARASVGLCFGPVFGVEIIADADFADAAEAAAIENLLRRHWTTIAATLETALVEPAVRYEPLLFEDDAGRVAANDWARGFSVAMRAEPAAWRAFDAAAPGMLEPVHRLLAEPGPDSSARYDDGTRAEFVAGLAALLVAAYGHFEPVRG